MKILAYEVGADERGVIVEFAHDSGVDVTCVADVPSMATASLAQGYDAVSFLGQGRIDAELIGAWHDMGVRFMSARIVGFNHIDVQAAHELGVRVCNSSYPPNGVAEFTIMLMLIALRKYKPALWRQQVNDYSLNGLVGRELGQQVVGIIGTGRIGSAVAACLRGFGCTIVAYDPYPNPDLADYVEYIPFDDLIARSDVITLHVALTPETDHMIDQASVERMKNGAIIVNCARGALCDTEALIGGIESGKLGAVAIDVIEGEEGITHIDHKLDILGNRKMAYLRQFPNVVMTQHMAFDTSRDIVAMAQGGIRGILEMSSGTTCRNEL